MSGISIKESISFQTDNTEENIQIINSSTTENMTNIEKENKKFCSPCPPNAQCFC
jgi:hypothetical protein